jgi:hypothetical protein
MSEPMGSRSKGRERVRFRCVKWQGSARGNGDAVVRRLEVDQNPAVVQSHWLASIKGGFVGNVKF